MNIDLQLKLQAYLDGELPPNEAQAIAELLSRDSTARDLILELTNTRAALGDFEAGIKLPETPEFYWSKIQREITKADVPVRTDAPAVSFFAMLRRLLAPAGTFLALLIGVILLGKQVQPRDIVHGVEAETSLADSEAFTYRDYASGTTLVWLSYPAENEFTQLNSDATLDSN